MGFYRRRWTNSWLRTRHHQLRPLSLLAHHLQHHCPSPAVPDATRSNTTTTNTFPLTATNTRPKHHTLNRNTTQLIRAVSNFELCIFGLGREREREEEEVVGWDFPYGGYELWGLHWRWGNWSLETLWIGGSGSWWVAMNLWFRIWMAKIWILFFSQSGAKWH